MGKVADGRVGSTLTLLVARVFADDANHPLPADDAAVFAQAFD
jgi:hypothetical protein